LKNADFRDACRPMALHFTLVLRSKSTRPERQDLR
jgi:hypothetical protein